jgi:Cornifin (SPRR) family
MKRSYSLLGPLAAILIMGCGDDKSPAPVSPQGTPPNAGQAGSPDPGQAGSPDPGQAGSPDPGQAGSPDPGQAGSPDPGPLAQGLSYSDPVAAPGDWKLVRDAASSSTRLVLNLLGPANGTKYRGVGFTLRADPAKIKIARLDHEAYFKDAGVFLDKDNAGNDMAPSLQAGGVRDGKLMVGIFQKTDEGFWGPQLGATAKDCSGVVLQVALDFDPGLLAKVGDVPLDVLKARAIPEKVDTLASRKMVDVTFRVGALTLH